jgi:hypothetical protein
MVSISVHISSDLISEYGNVLRTGLRVCGHMTGVRLVESEAHFAEIQVLPTGAEQLAKPAYTLWVGEAAPVESQGEAEELVSLPLRVFAVTGALSRLCAEIVRRSVVPSFVQARPRADVATSAARLAQMLGEDAAGALLQWPSGEWALLDHGTDTLVGRLPCSPEALVADERLRLTNLDAESLAAMRASLPVVAGLPCLEQAGVKLLFAGLGAMLEHGELKVPASSAVVRLRRAPNLRRFRQLDGLAAVSAALSRKALRLSDLLDQLSLTQTQLVQVILAGLVMGWFKLCKRPPQGDGADSLDAQHALVANRVARLPLAVTPREGVHSPLLGSPANTGGARLSHMLRRLVAGCKKALTSAPPKPAPRNHG